MKRLKWLLIIVVVLAAILGLFLLSLGAFNRLTVTEKEMGPHIIAYESYVGEYKNTGPIFEKVGKRLKGEGIESPYGLGIYYDDPSKVPADKLRSDCGIVVKPEEVIKLKNKDYKVKIISKKNSITTEFPIKNMFSYMIGPMKAYPALMKYAQEKEIKNIGLVYEFYDMPNHKIIFVMEVNKNLKGGKK